MRTTKPLAQVYAEEQLPVMTAPPGGEARTITDSGTQKYVDSLGETQRVPKKKKAPKEEAAASPASC